VHRVIWGLVISVCLFAAVVGAQPVDTPDPDEAAIIKNIKIDPSPMRYWQLSRVRARHAAKLYQSWQRNGQAKEYQKALFYARSAAQLQPDWDEPWLLLGMIYAEMKADRDAMEAAAAALIKAVDANPANGRAQILLAQVLLEQGRYWSAIEQYQSLIAKNKAMQNGTVISQLTFCYIADGRVQAGLDYLLQLLQDESYQGDRDWVRICAAVLLKTRGDRNKAVNLLESVYLPDLEKRHGSENPKVKQIKYLIGSWKEER
jgi:lipopolysaccharide biosynthesis regulator YciM